MVKFKKGLLVITLVSLIMLSIRPFSIYADAADGEFDNDSVVGVQVQENEELLSGVQGTRYTFNIILDGFYVGDFQIHVEYDSYNVSSGNWDHYNIDRTVYVCGYDTYFETWMRENWLPPSSITWSSSVNNSDQCVYVGRMDSSQLLNTLIQFKNTYSSNSAVTNGFLNQIDQKIDNLLAIRQYSFPIESLNFAMYLLNNYNVYDINDYYSWTYPAFKIPNQGIIFSNYFTQRDRDYYLICDVDNAISDIDRLQNRITFSNSNFTFKSFEQLMRYSDGVKTHIVFKAVFSSSDSGSAISVNLINNTGGELKIIPFYCDQIYSNRDISTDFALVFGFSNKLLDDLHVIAAGNQASNNSASSLESSTSSFSSTASDVYNVEDQVSSGFSSSMQNIPSSFNFQNNFGSSFVVSASWVRDQFNNMTANNPFGSLITFSLILGVALLIIGRLLT